MTPLNLSDPMAAAIHARPAHPTIPVWIYSPERRKWCVLRTAEPAHPAVALCLAPLPSGPLEVRTTKPHNTCPACETELAAGTPGAAAAVEPEFDEITEPRTKTADLLGPRRNRTDSPLAWDGDGRSVQLGDGR